MPIGLLIGWLIGQLIIGLSIVHYNGHPRPLKQTEAATLARQIVHTLGLILTSTSFFGLLGTFAELIVR